MKNEEKNGLFPPFSKPLRAEFKDSDEWGKLMEQTRYVLPGWEVAPTVPLMELWLERLNISKHLYIDSMQTSLKEWLDLNQDWPLRAFVGLLLEYKSCN